MPSNNLILCLSLPLPSSIFPSIRIFSNQAALHIQMFPLSSNLRVMPTATSSGDRKEMRKQDATKCYK